ncbi:four helix bundle protein [Sinomicrobium soli]|uniref:four helix bundle protein n=1 Tax=Sinomicrobium sp. N-1-3-6 TaxID=2219864 RepID=UPI000DCBF029|nr:four helix bundle protein [Sinomicrobium sp. N-1-3-6]RAV30168.1 four helix bundle protein [Sinomicrobium sp. N-1-3-6]
MGYQTFEDLEVWKLARQLKKDIRKLTREFPAEEKYRLTDQVIRSSRSIGSNISEGFGRFHYKENSKFCRNARGSLMETLSHLIDAFDEEYINEQTLSRYKIQILHCNKVLNGYIAYLNKRSMDNQ